MSGARCEIFTFHTWFHDRILNWIIVQSQQWSVSNVSHQNKAIMRRYYDTLNILGAKSAWVILGSLIVPNYICHTPGPPDLQLGTENVNAMQQGYFDDTAE